jgi:phage-related protein
MEVVFFNSGINDFLLTLEKSTYAKVVRQIKLLEIYSYKLSMPYSKPISKNLFELRIRGQQEIRIFYCFYKNKSYLLHVFIKKTRKTPKREIEIAEKRMVLLI